MAAITVCSDFGAPQNSMSLFPLFHNLFAMEVMPSRLPGEIAVTSDMQMTPPLWQKVKRN